MEKPRTELRKLPHTTDPESGVSLICKECYVTKEKPFRIEQNRNRTLPSEPELPTPEFEELEPCRDQDE